MNIRKYYNEEGFFVARSLLDTRDVLRANEESLRRNFSSNIARYVSLLSMMAKDVKLIRLLTSDKVMGFLRELGITEPVMHGLPSLHVLSDTMRINDGYFGTVAHQDWSSMQSSLDAITVWVPFTKTDNYPLEVIPKSHLNGLLPGQFNGSVLEVKSRDRDFIQVQCLPGDVVFMSSFLVHRTGDGSREMRVAASARFDNASEPTFIERGWPCAQKRVVDRRIEWAPTRDQVRKVFE